MANKLSTDEKMSLLRHHGEAIARAFSGIRSPNKDELLEHAQRAVALIKSIPKLEYAIDE